MTDEDIDAIRMSLPPSASHFVFARAIEAAVRKTCEVACAQALMHARATEREWCAALCEAIHARPDAVAGPVERPVRPLYAERDHAAQGDYYTRHVDAMTREGLHAKSAIAGELAHRDMEIERLRVTLANESRRVCGTENDCVLQPHCSHAQKCMRPEWDAKV